jgi:hypothetical protein
MGRYSPFALAATRCRSAALPSKIDDADHGHEETRREKTCPATEHEREKPPDQQTESPATLHYSPPPEKRRNATARVQTTEHPTAVRIQYVLLSRASAVRWNSDPARALYHE